MAVKDSGFSIPSVILGELVDKALFLPLVVGLVAILDPATMPFSVAALLVGSACTLAGAFFAADRAKRRFIAHALMVAALTFAISFARFLFVMSGDEPSVHPLWWEFLSRTLTFAAGYLGGRLALQRASA